MDRFFETHFHLEALKEFPPSQVLELARAQGVEQFVAIASAPENLKTVQELADQFPCLLTTQGIHPHEAKHYNSELGQQIKASALKNPKVVAIGEIGLDYHYDFSPRETQKAVLKSQLEIALACKRPVVLHNRESDQDMMEILSGYVAKLRRENSGRPPGVIHSFSSSPQLAEWAIEHGFYLGLNGMVTFKNAHSLRSIVSTIPPEKILFETDSPYLTPVPHRGKENGPRYIPFVAKKVAEILAIAPSLLYPQVYKNSETLFQKRV